jgi:hypothetical protein
MKKIYKAFYFVICVAAVTLITNGLSAQPVSFQTIPDTIAVVNNPYTYDADASPAVNNYSLDVKLPGMIINSTSGIITWTPASDTSGGRVVVRATNSSMQTATQEFYINVSTGIECASNVDAYWKLDEWNGPTYEDSKGTLDANTNTGGALIDTTGIVGRAQVFIPDNDNQLSVPSNDIFNWGPSDNFSIEFWYNNRVDNLTTNSVMIGRNTGSSGVHWWIGMNQTEKVNFYLRMPSGPGIEDSINESSNFNTWYHVIMVRNADEETIKLYRIKAGESKRSSPGASYDGSGYGFSTTVPLTMGWLKPGTGDMDQKYQYDGKLDEVVLYNVALNEAQVDQRFNGGNPLPACPYGNFAPLFKTIPTTSVDEESSYSYQCRANDIDGDILAYTVPTKPAWLNWDNGTKTLSGTPSDNDVGIFDVTIRVNDGTVNVNQDFQITVNNINDKPVLSGIEGTALGYDEDDGKVPVTSTITVTDVDDVNIDSARISISANYVNGEDVLAFTNTANITGTWNASSGVLRLTGTTTKANYQAALRAVTYENTDNVDPTELTRTVRLTVNDGALNSDPVIRNITVTSVNDCPVISAHASLTTPEEDTILIKMGYLTFTDVDNVPGDFSIAVASGTNYTYAGNIVTPALNFSGTLNVNVKLSDLECTVDYVLPVSVTGINDPPEFNFASLPTDAYEQQSYLLTIRAFDPDPGDVVTYSVTQKPDWLNVISDTILTGVPEFSDIGANPVTIRISDSKVNVDTTFIINVHSSNYIPHITSTPLTEIDEDELYSYNITVVDTNSQDPLILSAPILPAWLTLNAVQQTLTGLPTNDQVGYEESVDYTVQLKAYDGKQDSTQTFKITVYNVNDAPVILGQVDTILVHPDQSTAITLSDLDVEDVDNPSDELTLIVLPGSGYSIAGNTITINTSTLGLLGVGVRVSDGEEFDESVYYVKVTEGSGIKDFSTDASGIVNVYPVPARDHIIFEINSAGIYNIEIINITGRTVYNNKFELKNDPVEINISDMTDGLYFYRIYNDNEQFIGKVTVKK